MSKFKLGDFVRKTKGSRWSGRVVGTYSTELTLEGYAVESSSERGSVQIYPASALEEWPVSLATAVAQALHIVPDKEGLRPPKIGQLWVGQGGIYAGVTRGEDGQPDRHLVLSTTEPDKQLNWADACEWAKTVEADGHSDYALPTRSQNALLHANLGDRFDPLTWGWTSTQHRDSAYAWVQYARSGTHTYMGKSAEARARAVREVPL